MAMIEFEDKMPAPSMSWGERVFMWFIIAMQVLSLAQCTAGLVPA